MRATHTVEVNVGGNDIAIHISLQEHRTLVSAVFVHADSFKQDIQQAAGQHHPFKGRDIYPWHALFLTLTLCSIIKTAFTVFKVFKVMPPTYRLLTVVVDVGVNHIAVHINIREDLFVGLVDAEAANLWA